MKYFSLVFATAITSVGIADPLSESLAVTPASSAKTPTSTEVAILSETTPFSEVTTPLATVAFSVAVSSEDSVTPTAVSSEIVGASPTVAVSSQVNASFATVAVPIAVSSSVNTLSSVAIANATVTIPWETETVAEIHCSAPTQTNFSDWVSAIGNAADSLSSIVNVGIFPSVVAAVGSVVCEFEAISGNFTLTSAHNNLAEYSNVNARVAIALTELAAKADTLSQTTTPASLRVRSLFTLQDYVREYIYGARKFEGLMSVAIESDTVCNDRVIFSSDVDFLSSAFNAAASVFSISVSKLTAPGLCTADVLTPSSTVNIPTHYTEIGSVTTTVVTAYTTYCPEPTTLCLNGICHTVTKATTLTITDCPCTITYKSFSQAPLSKPTTLASQPTNVVPSNSATTFGSKMLLAAIGILVALL